MPRLLAQPIYRDDVVNGKFVAGLTSIGLILAVVMALVGVVGIIQLGILPSAEDVARLIVWWVLALVYIGFWLAFALLCSVLVRRAATSAIIALSAWLLLSVFFSLVVGVVAGVHLAGFARLFERQSRHDCEHPDAGEPAASVAEPALLRGDGRCSQSDHSHHARPDSSLPARPTRRSAACCRLTRACS